MKISAILFDIDGTLVDSNDGHVDAWDRAFREEGYQIDVQAIHDQIGKGGDLLVPALLPQVADDVAKRLEERHGAIFTARHLGRVQPFAGARDLLAAVHKAGQTVVLASSAQQSEVDHYLGLLDARALVAATTSSDEVGTSKPAGDIFAKALEKIAPLGPDDVMVVGDTPYDIAAARACGIATVAVRSGGFPDAALEGAVAIYDDVAALLADLPHSPLSR